jgi:hypothetical protein
MTKIRKYDLDTVKEKAERMWFIEIV